MELTRRNFVAGSATAALAAAAGSVALADEAQAAAEDTASSPDWLGEAPEIADADIVETKTCELLIIGAGNAGLAAAATAADLGLDFMVCEKNEAVTGARMWIGAVNTRYHEAAGIEVDEGRLLNELGRYASFKCNQAVWKTWIDESSEMLDWASGIMGAEPELDTEGYDHETGGTYYYVPPIQHMFGMDDGDRDEVFAQYVSDKGHPVSFGYDLKKLLRDGDGPVTGAIFETADGYVKVEAANTILCTGGYPGNPSMVRACSPIVDRCVTADGYMAYDDGYGIRAAMWVGARKDAEGAPMIFDRGACLPGTDAGYADDSDTAKFQSTYGGIGQFGMGSQPFMKVSRNGVRFANESCPYDFICHAASEQPGGVWCQVFDANAYADMQRFQTVGCSKGALRSFGETDVVAEALADEIENGFLKQADTLDDLADQLGFEDEAKDAFLAQVERYNEMYDAQKDDQFGKEAFRLSAIRTAPFYGCWFGGTLLTTVDGVCIDENMRVLDADAQPIEGLFAAGDCSGSLFCGNYPEYIVGCACGRTLTFGRHAVRYIAGDLETA